MIIIILILLLIFQNINCFYFSVIIPIYNTARYLNDSIGSLINQTIGFKNIQVILVNDGSTDNTEEICLYYQMKYEINIIYIKIPHSGVSKARNEGLKYAKGMYINFLDSDDKWDSKAFINVYLFFKFHTNIDLIGGRMKYFESKNVYHFLDYKFQMTRVVDLSVEYSCIQLSCSSSFFRFSSIKEKKFEDNIISGEDVRFISNLLFTKPIIGLVKEAIYYYRKRADGSSTIQNTEKNKKFYFETIKLVQQYIIDKSIAMYNKILPFIQFYIAYETLFRMKSLAYIFLGSNDYSKYCNMIENLLRQIEEKYILEQKVFSTRLQIFALSKKYNRDIENDIIFRNNCFIYSNYIMMNFSRDHNIIIWISLEIQNNKLHLEGEDRFWMSKENYFYFCTLRNTIFYPKYYLDSGSDFLTMYGLITRGRIVIFDINLEQIDEQNLHFFLSYMGKNIEILSSFRCLKHMPPLKNSYYISEKYIIKNNNGKLIVSLKNSELIQAFEHDYSLELKRQQKYYLVKIRKNYMNNINQMNKQSKSQIWLINDRKDEAGDNGEYFFRYLYEIKPKGIKFYFVIEKNCSDYNRLKQFENIIDFNSSIYINLFLKADKILLSVFENWVYNPFGIDGKYMIDLYHFDFIHLQSGILRDKLSRNPNGYKKNFDLLMTSSKKEYKTILEYNYDYNYDNIAITGMARFDNLKILQKNMKSEKLILIYPTWRKYIKGTLELATQKSIISKSFMNSTFFNFYNGLISNQQLLNFMQKNDYKGIFCLNQDFDTEYMYFHKNKLFTIKDKCNQQELFVKASLLITDYSNIFFDFGYLQKLIIYAHFDYDIYRSYHFFNGYFNYKNDGFGPICYEINCIIKTIISAIENNCKLKNKYALRIKRFFRYLDDKNNYRIYTEIMKGKNKGKFTGYITKLNYFIILSIISKASILYLYKYYL